ncbi:MAG: hypothetical protein Harvfovirus10_3 [Harvfovirus sp.]|uniref:Uncharacterized protein n=1 Tax=Harvfovirus sp. TaxID=2487768 RepID=A0A3G5A120_9VIRU|nr:MAG: hypothetical protein Harvfovirus10_3 [Harvfovirus sp.]
MSAPNDWKTTETDTIELIWKDKIRYSRTTEFKCKKCKISEDICPCAQTNFIENLTYDDLNLRKQFFNPNWRNIFYPELNNLWIVTTWKYNSKYRKCYACAGTLPFCFCNKKQTIANFSPDELIKYWKERNVDYKSNWKIFERANIEKIYAMSQRTVNKDEFIEKFTFEELELFRRLVNSNWRELYRDDILNIYAERKQLERIPCICDALMEEFIRTCSESDLIIYWQKKSRI